MRKGNFESVSTSTDLDATGMGEQLGKEMCGNLRFGFSARLRRNDPTLMPQESMPIQFRELLGLPDKIEDLAREV